MSKSKEPKLSAASNKITRLEFCATHYRGLQQPTDMFYVNLANRIFPVIHKVFSAQPGFTSEVSKRMAVTLACYVEDLVADTGVWTAFVSLYKKKYKNSFPFYNIRENGTLYPYDEETPSFHAVLFLLWYVANGVNPETILNPNNPALRMLAMGLLPDLMDAYDDAPDTPGRRMLMPEEELGIPLFYQIRNLCEWLSDRCYLTRINDRKKVTAEFENFIDMLLEKVGTGDKGMKSYALESYVPMNALIGPLAIPAYEWLAEIVTLSHDPEEEKYIPILAALKSRPYQYYKYETVGEKELVLKDMNDEKLILSAATMPGEKFPSDVVPGKTALMSLVLFDGVWLMNGLGLQVLPGEVYEESREKHREKVKQRKDAFKYLLKAFHKQRLGVCGSYEEYLKRSCGSNALRTNDDPKLLADIRDAGNLVYFLNSDGTVSILPGWATCVKIDDNPYYDKEDASSEGLALILGHSLTTPEMRDYIIKNKLIPDAALSSMISEEAGRKMFQKNIRFLNDYTDRDSMQSLEDI